MALRSLKRGLGGAIDGVAAEYFVCDEAEAVKIPSNWDCKDGSTLAVSAVSNSTSCTGSPTALRHRVLTSR
jgi:threonine dehydrogenase-like Zn-dependent dehydrogenase